ncbi:tetratricopeptide repeat protein [Paraburkholderia sp. MMS20-SJTR3]|uniref:protein O-GlcNAc transferase n=1 Tax=Paraburkholderia sejongensis TaxID=2886946 RepID=A0ABS8JTL4_9BURK|nr:glycosyltransferase family 41 protein [Paraburkholderia sp. MMS20-SJTR3]MCC8393250.1 tetratricopeptide repeat protein [Paraburkholderia sp. MMS20-SJTR3]
MTALHTATDTTTLPPEAKREWDIDRMMQTAFEHHHKQEYAEAAALYARVLDADSNHLDAHYHMGVLRLQTDLPAEAAPHFEVVLGQTPRNGQVWVYYINALVGSGQSEAAQAALELARQHGLPDDAVRTLRARISGEADPLTVAQQAEADAGAAAPLGDGDVSGDAPAAAESEGTPRLKLDTRRASSKELRAFEQLYNSGKHDAALKLARRLTQRYPSHGECWFELGRVLQATGHYKEAVETAEHAARLLPNSIVAQTTLADRLVATLQHKRAEEHCVRALKRYPESAALHRGLGAALLETGRAEEGFVHLQRAVELAPNNALEHDALATALGKHGLYEEAEAAFRRALELAPMQPATHSNLLFYVMHKPDIDASGVFKEFREFAARHEAPLRSHRLQHTNDRDPSRRLRIGFVSGDLLNHPVAYFLLSVLEQLVRDPSLSLHLYSNYAVTDGFTMQLREHSHAWTEIFGMTDEAVTQKIRDDRIDVLIDLSGHTGRNRLKVFAQKPAPVQVSWIGNPATTGLDAVDYYMSDRFVTPLEQFERFFSEKLVFLPALAPFKPHPQAPEVNELPALKNGFLTFGSFSRIVKIGKEVVALWARVLREVSNSRLLIGGIAAKDQMLKLTDMLVKEGIDVSRISFLPRGSVTTYLEQHHLIDVCLDTFPFGNSTTTMQALWMGVPTMTLPGDSMASRSSTGWLSHLGLDAAFVAEDKDDFVRKCAALAADPQALAAVRRELREHCRKSALIDAGAIANAATRAFRIMWQRWCDGQEPEHFEVLVEPTATSIAEPLAARLPAFTDSAETKNRIYQIYYSDATRARVEPGFVALDNTGQRPDWREYWPMRKFLLETQLDANARYGFFSPKFTEKTGLRSSDVHAFLDSVSDDVDVVTFSPFFDQGAFSQNVFEHAAEVHPGLGPVIDELLAVVAPGIDTRALVMTAAQSVFCNYFVAKPAFWMEWLKKCEQIFAIAEAGSSPLARKINDDVKYNTDAAPAKVFIIERIASLLLATQPEWKTRQFDPLRLPMTRSPIARFQDGLLILDALKHAMRTTGFSHYLETYLRERAALRSKSVIRNALK